MVWHEGLIFKVKMYGVDGNHLKLLENYLTNCKQRVVLNGQTSLRQNILAGIPRGSVLGTLLFVIYINYLPGRIASICTIFADDTLMIKAIVIFY